MAILSRRNFLIAGGVIAGTAVTGLGVGVAYLNSIDTTGLRPKLRPDGTALLNAFVRIGTDGTITFTIPRTEMGQGVLTGLATLIAEELEVDLDDPRLTVIHAPEALPVYANFTLALEMKRPEDRSGIGDWVKSKLFGAFPYIATGGSTSVVDGWVRMREAGAAARVLLVEAAARDWRVPAGECTAKAGAVHHAASGRSAEYGALAARAATLTLGAVPALKDPSAFTRIGHDQPRVDIPAKIDGSAVFGADIELPDQLYASVELAPVLGQHVRAVDDAAARAMPGVVAVARGEDFVGVVAHSWWRARKACEALKIDWRGTAPPFSTASFAEELRARIRAVPAKLHIKRGSLSNAKGKLVEAVYEAPFETHAAMEPRGATALLHADGRAEIWGSSQTPLALAWGFEQAAKDLGLRLEGDVITHVSLNGGAFGGRSEIREFKQAAMLAAAAKGRPVKLIWTRAQDIQHGICRTAAAAHLKVFLGPDGFPVTFQAHVAAQALQATWAKRNLPAMAGDPNEDKLGTEGLVDMPYAIPTLWVGFTHVETPMPIGFWRANGYAFNVFFLESFIEECAAAAGRDPLDYRLALLTDPRHRAVLERLRAAAGLDRPLADGRARGIAFSASFKSICAQAAEVSRAADGTIRIERVTAVLDCGLVINPDIVRAQIEGAIMWGLSAGLFGGLTVEGGQVVETSHADYRVVQFDTAPGAIEVVLMEGEDRPGGVGEPGTPPAAAAVANAISALTGERKRALPLIA